MIFLPKNPRTTPKSPIDKEEEEEEEMEADRSSKHFVLIHGACHGAWCWYKLVPLLKLAGHRVTALDLGASGVNPKRLEELQSASDYVQPLTEFIATLPQNERVILVGHSYGGFCMSLAMEKFPDKILVAVFVTSYMPNCISPPATQLQEFFKRAQADFLLDCQITFDRGQENPPASAILGPNFVETKMYHNCQPEDKQLAKSLLRPFKFFSEDFAKENMLSEANFGSINRVFVMCEEDKIMTEEFQQWIIEDSPANDVKIISGAGHMAMLSKPKELCLCLQEIADKY